MPLLVLVAREPKRRLVATLDGALERPFVPVVVVFPLLEGLEPLVEVVAHDAAALEEAGAVVGFQSVVARGHGVGAELLEHAAILLEGALEGGDGDFVTGFITGFLVREDVAPDMGQLLVKGIWMEGSNEVLAEFRVAGMQQAFLVGGGEFFEGLVELFLVVVGAEGRVGVRGLGGMKKDVEAGFEESLDMGGPAGDGVVLEGEVAGKGKVLTVERGARRVEAREREVAEAEDGEVRLNFFFVDKLVLDDVPISPVSFIFAGALGNTGGGG
jgi:hypothetical protein